MTKTSQVLHGSAGVVGIVFHAPFLLAGSANLPRSLASRPTCSSAVLGLSSARSTGVPTPQWPQVAVRRQTLSKIRQGWPMQSMARGYLHTWDRQGSAVSVPAAGAAAASHSCRSCDSAELRPRSDRQIGSPPSRILLQPLTASGGSGSSGGVSIGLWCKGGRRPAAANRRCYSKRSLDGSQDRPPPSRLASSSSPPPQQELKGIRKVLPKVLPSLTPHEDIYTVPNLLTFSRLIAAPFIGYAILHDAHAWALGLFVYAGVSDLLDGWIARRWNLQTVVGSVVDPMADKTLMTVMTVCLATQGLLPVWLAVIILGRDAGLGIAAIYYRWISLPPPKTFMRYWDFSLPSAEVRPTTISKYNTFLQLSLIGATMVTPVVSADLGMAMTGFQYLVATTTVWSGLSYVFSKDAVKILSQSDKPGKEEKP